MCVVLCVSMESSVTPNSCVCVFVGIVVSICRCKLVLYSSGSGVTSVEVVLSGLRMSFFPLSMCVIVVDMVVCML